MQRSVRLSNDNGTIVTIMTGAPTTSYSLLLPDSLNPSLTKASVLYGLGNGQMNWAQTSSADVGYLLLLMPSGGNLIPTWTSPNSSGFVRSDEPLLTFAADNGSLSNNRVISVAAGLSISNTGVDNGSVVMTNTGVLKLTSSSGIVLSDSTGNITISGTPGWQFVGNAARVDNTSNLFGTLDSIPIRFVSGRNGPNTRMYLDPRGYVGIGTTSPTATLDVNGAITTRESSIALSSSGSNNNVAVGNSSFVSITGPTSAFTITGISGGNNGQRLHLVNKTGYAMTLTNLDAASSAGNRILSMTGNSVTLKGSSQSAELIYDTASSGQWILNSTGADQFSGPVGTIQFIIKSADQTITNSATLTDDNDFSFAVSASQTWEVTGEMTSDNTVNLSNIRVAFSIPTGATSKVYFTGIQDAGVGAVIQANSQTSGTDDAKIITITGATSTRVSFHGFVTTGSTAGSVKLRWAQGTANIVGTTVRANSFMKFLRVK